ncbi:response regulator [Jonesia quinghaiensis]|uniref:response regulator n=1 Tax=Jonesia quinghaiensis TaxID=262806 RepID=UPI000412A463|nr:response regulator transcription factor [Jonesia quinghaiensis]
MTGTGDNNQDIEQLRLVIVDDDALVRAGLRMILGGDPAITVVAEGTNGDEALALYGQHKPDVVLMDIRMPVRDGLSATNELINRWPDANVLVLTTFDTDEFIVKALRAGARGFLLKDTSPPDLVRAVKLAGEGQPTLSPSVTAQLIAKVSEEPDTQAQRAARADVSTLTERELEVARQIARGLSNSEIGQTLFMSIPTVKTHISRIFAKFQVENRVQIAIRMHDADID